MRKRRSKLRHQRKRSMRELLVRPSGFKSSMTCAILHQAVLAILLGVHQMDLICCGRTKVRLFPPERCAGSCFVSYSICPKHCWLLGQVPARLSSPNAIVSFKFQPHAICRQSIRPQSVCIACSAEYDVHYQHYTASASPRCYRQSTSRSGSRIPLYFPPDVRRVRFLLCTCTPNGR